jgi:hypothetical protein
MPDNIYPDRSNSGFDIKYNQLKILASDLKARFFNRGVVTSHPQTGDSGGDDNPPPGNNGCKLVYVANLSQASTSNPLALVYENTIGPIIWTRVSTGVYRGTLTDAFPIDNTWVMVDTNYLKGIDDKQVKFNVTANDDYVEIQAEEGGSLSDDILDHTSIEIRTYCASADGACTAVEIAEGTLPLAASGIPYSYSLSLMGTAPFTLGAVTKPSWMTIAIVGSTLEFTGTPSDGDAGTGITVSVEVNNCTAGTATFSGTVDVVVLGDFILEHDVETLDDGYSQISMFRLSGSPINGYVDWGDGIIEPFTINGGIPLLFSHTYATDGTYERTWYFDSNTNLSLIDDSGEGDYQKVNKFSHSDNFTSLAGIIQLTGVMNINNVLPPAATHIPTMEIIGYIASPQTSCDLTSLPSGVKSIQIQGFPVLATITNIPSSLTNGYSIQQNPLLTAVNSGGSLPNAHNQQLSDNADGLVFGTLNLAACNNFIFNQDFSVSQVNAFLVALDANGISNGNADVTQTPVAAPTGAGATAKTSLLGKSWTLNTD